MTPTKKPRPDIHRDTKFSGIYQVPEISRFLLAARMAHELYPIASRRLIRWIRRGLVDPGLAGVPGREILVTFEDLVSLRIIAALRAAGVSFPRIYAAEEYLRRATESPRPFATEVLWTDRSEVFASLKSHLVSASRAGQLAMEIMQAYLIPVHGLSFGEKGRAISWEPVDRVELAPSIQFGAPCVKGTRIPTRAIWNSRLGGDSIAHLADSYGLAEDDLTAAVQWEERLAA